MDWHAARVTPSLAVCAAVLLLPPGVWLATMLWRGWPLAEALLILPLRLPSQCITLNLAGATLR